MVEEDKHRLDILHQIWAVRAALNKTSEILLENYIRNCLQKSSEKDNKKQTVEELTKALKVMQN